MRQCNAFCQMLKVKEGVTANLCPAPPLMAPVSPSTYKLTFQNLPCLLCVVCKSVIMQLLVTGAHSAAH